MDDTKLPSSMTVGLKMNPQNNAYTIISLLFFIPYIIFQKAAIVLLRKIGPRKFLSTMVLLWGVVMIVSLQNSNKKYPF